MWPNEKFSQLKALYYQLVPDLSEESWLKCENALTVRTLNKGAIIMKEGQTCNHVSFINFGLVRMYHLTDGKEKTVCFTNENTYLSDYHSFLTRKPSNKYLQAIEPTELVEINYDNLQMLYREVPEANQIGRMICEQVFIAMNDDSESRKNIPIEKRYTQLIAEQPWLLQKVPQYMIASLLGITPEALSRVKARMNKPIAKSGTLLASKQKVKQPLKKRA